MDGRLGYQFMGNCSDSMRALSAVNPLTKTERLLLTETSPCSYHSLNTMRFGFSQWT